MCIRDRYQRRVHGESLLSQEKRMIGSESFKVPLVAAGISRQQSMSSSRRLRASSSQQGSRGGVPVVSALSWSVHDGRSGELLWGKMTQEKREIASLTKMMTAHTTLVLARRLNIDLEQTAVKVTRAAAYIIGTVANLRAGDNLSILDLLYGMLLPSGNDAALSLAIFFGGLLDRTRRLTQQDNSTHAHVDLFIKEMNKQAYKLGLRETSFTNAHGLSEKGNKSTCADLGRLCFIILQDELLRKIVGTKTHRAAIIDFKGRERMAEWTNTNKLLEEPYYGGVKTGICLLYTSPSPRDS
eukprot:TRINITY_DN7819_c0_g1_i2.p1 TRINITY_DN7819_c0_g1~~TRINITY_DN7819_c0_g1_i2.p1  ORF type:complete len:298 (-),score=66.71 TRINITY_DN7819_c0_g1_i2:35-928(-)